MKFTFPNEEAYTGQYDLQRFDTNPFLTKVQTFGNVKLYKVSLPTTQFTL